MDFDYSDKVKALREKLTDFMDRHVYPAESVHEEQRTASGDKHFHPPVMEELKAKAKAAGLWKCLTPPPPCAMDAGAPRASCRPSGSGGD